MQRCYCESSLCDHGGACKRPADDRLVMEYVVHTCVECAGHMIESGGADYIMLAPDFQPLRKETEMTFRAKFFGGHLDGAIYESPDPSAIAIAVVEDAGMMEVFFDPPINGAEPTRVPNAVKLAEWFKRYSTQTAIGYVKIGDPSASDSMLVKVEVH